ncbi:DUF4390 domain-containing protein [Desulfocastanea catecholica]
MHCKPKLFSLIVLVIMIFSTIAGAQVAPEKKATINELTATTSETHLIVFGTLENSFTSEMIDLLHSGIPLRFSFYVELYKTTENWRDELIITNNFQHILTFDTLKENYKVTLEEDNNKVLSFRSLLEAQKEINEINGVKVVELEQLLPDNRYKLKMKAELYRKTLPLSLHNILPFLSWWDIETDWHTLTFTF